MDRFPTTLSERATLDAMLSGRSVARFGDGELRLAIGVPAKPCKTQDHDPRLQQELAAILRGKTSSLICLPNLYHGLPDYDRNWRNFVEHRKWSEMINDGVYGSSFVTRADVVPSINTDDYWAKFKRLWEGKSVVLVIGRPVEGGKDHSLVPHRLLAANDVRTVYGPQTNAYEHIYEIERDIMGTAGRPRYPGVVLLCLGATATCLAERLAQRGVHALDLGHLGRFMSKRHY